MLSIDDRTGNVVTTVTLFLLAAAVLYLAHIAFFILLLSLLFAYLLEPLVVFAQQHTRLGRKNRSWAIAEVYLVGIVLLGSIGYKTGPILLRQIKSLNAAVPQIIRGQPAGNAAPQVGTNYGLSAPQQQQIHDWMARNHELITRLFERFAVSATYVAESAIWLFVIPILAIFILRDGPWLADEIVNSIARGRDQMLRQILSQVDSMLGKYVRAQVALAGLSFLFYTASMVLLGFPYAVALGLVGGALEFLPAVGWVATAATILTIGFLTHAHWIWMALLLLLWRLVQDYVNSPRIMGDNLQLQPLTVLFALMVGGQVGGIPGLYLSVPTVAVLRIVWLGCAANRSSSIAISDKPLAQVQA